jgi:MFS family permease
METAVYPKSRWLMMFAVMFAWIGLGVMVVACSPIIGEISSYFQVEVGTMSLLTMGLYSMSTAVFAVISGPLFDKFNNGTQRIVMIGTIIVMVGAILTPVLVTSVPGLVVQRLLTGIGGGPIMACMAKLSAEWFPEKERPTYIAVASSGFAIGIIISFMFAGRIAAEAGWQSALARLAVVPIVAAVFYIVVVIVTRKVVLPSVEAHDAEMGGSIDHAFKKLAKTPVLYLLILMGICYTWSLNAFNDLTPGYMAIDPPMGIGKGAVFAGSVMIAVQLGNVVGSLLSGICITKLFKGNSKVALFVMFLINCICCISIKASFVYDNLPVLIVALFLVGFSISNIMPNVAFFASTRLPVIIVGRVYGTALGVGLIVGSLGVSLGSAALLMTGTYTVSIMIVGAIALIGSFGALGIKRPKVFGAKEKEAS